MSIITAAGFIALIAYGPTLARELVDSIRRRRELYNV